MALSGAVGTRSTVGGHGAAKEPAREPKGEFVSGELAADCARFLAETRRRVEQRQLVTTQAGAAAGGWHQPQR
jgi:hypothetical protein